MTQQRALEVGWPPGEAIHSSLPGAGHDGSRVQHWRQYNMVAPFLSRGIFCADRFNKFMGSISLSTGVLCEPYAGCRGVPVCIPVCIDGCRPDTVSLLLMSNSVPLRKVGLQSETGSSEIQNSNGCVLLNAAIQRRYCQAGSLFCHKLHDKMIFQSNILTARL
jgi:hypothetical protein